MASDKFWEIISRGETGVPLTTQEFDMMVFKKAKKLAKKYELKFDPENIVMTDEDMIDNAFKAGVELLLDLGIYNIDSGKVINITEEEIFDTLRRSSSVIELGEGKDKIMLKRRKIEDPELPIIVGGCGNQVTEDIRYKLYLAYAMNPMIDYIEPLPPYKFRGMLVKAGTPFELQACMDNISLYRKACAVAGRPGTPIKGKDGVSAVADIATNREDYGYRKSDHSNVYFKPQMKTTYEDLNRAAQYTQYGSYVSTAGCAYIGGFCGGVEGAVICCIAESIAGIIVYNGVINAPCVMESLYPSQTTKKSLWGTNLASAAMNKHTSIPAVWGSYMTAAGPCTDMALYEIAVAAIGTVIMGNNPFGCAPNQGVTINYCTPMEPQFMGEVAYATTLIDRKQANEISLQLIPKYEERLLAKTPPKGKTFQELYNLDTLLPNQEYVELKDKIWEELEAMGLKKFEWKRY